PGAPINASVDVFNLGAEWSASNTAVATGPAGQFDVLVSTANAHGVIDVLGEYGPAPASAAGPLGPAGPAGTAGPEGPPGPNDLAGNLAMVDSTASAGNITKNGNRFLHNAGSGNAFLGVFAGNFTMAGVGNTGVGVSALQNNTSSSLNSA